MAEPAPPSWNRARRAVWTLILLFILLWGVGKSWDERYHITNLFDTFWSPPHLFIYSGYLLVALLFLRLLFWMRETHRHLGPALRVPILAFPVPAPLLLMGFGFLFTGVAGLIDSKYHEALGLRETHWSLPHVMLGMSGFLTVLGFAAAFVALALPGRAREGTGGDLALRREHPLSRGTLPLAFWGLFVFATGAVLGPAFGVAVPQMYQAVLDNRIPGVEVAIGDDLRWSLETSVARGFTRAHPVVFPAVAFIAAALLASLRHLTPGRWSGAAWATLYTLLAVWDTGVAAAAWRLYDMPGHAPAHVLPFPLLGMVLVLGLLEKRMGRWAYAVAGVFGGAVWNTGPAGMLFGALAALGGREAARGLRRVATGPTRREVAATAFLFGVVVPAVLGGIDIALRTGKYWWLV
ncbi:MAG: hypothetical protein QXO51_07025 [Halobacteria archaeon]